MATATKLVKIESQLKPGSNACPRSLTAENVAQVTDVSTETVAQWRSKRQGVPFLKISRNCVRYRQADFEAWLSERVVRVEADPSNAARRI